MQSVPESNDLDKPCILMQIWSKSDKTKKVNGV